MTVNEILDEVKKKFPDWTEDDWTFAGLIFSWAWMKTNNELTDEEALKWLELVFDQDHSDAWRLEHWEELKKQIQDRKRKGIIYGRRKDLSL